MMDKVLDEDGFMETSVLKNGMKGPHLPSYSISLDRRETESTKIMPTGKGHQESWRRAYRYGR